MPDFTLCRFKDCPIGQDCYRLQAKPNSYQPYHDFSNEYDESTNYCWYRIELPTKRHPDEPSVL